MVNDSKVNVVKNADQFQMKYRKRVRNIENKAYDYRWTENGTSLYMIVLVLVFPLFFRNNYIDILEAKTFIFVFSTWIYLILFIVLIWLESIFRAENEHKLKARRKGSSYKKHQTTKKVLKQDIFFIIFLCAVVISTLCSGDIVNSWYAPECKLFGARILLLCGGVYLCVSKGYIINKAVRISFAVGIGAVFALAIFNRYGIDPLQMQSDLLEKQKVIYISTIGNVNILAGFICIFLPLCMGIFIYHKNLQEKIVSAVLVYTGVMAGIATNSDSFFLGYGVSMFFFLWFGMISLEKVTRYLAMCIICVGAMLTLQIFNKISDYDYVWYDFQETLINEIPWTVIILVLALALMILKKMRTDFNWCKVRKICFIAISICIVIFIFYLIKVNVAGDSAAGKYLLFNEEWGTNRGFVWIHTCELFRELPLFKQIFGIGPGGFKDFFEIYNEQRALNGLVDFADPHSDYLYFLVSTGIVGLIGYIGMIISAIIECLKVHNENTIIIASVIISFVAQATVNNPLVFSAPYLFLFLAMSRHESTCYV